MPKHTGSALLQKFRLQPSSQFLEYIFLIDIIALTSDESLILPISGYCIQQTVCFESFRGKQFGRGRRQITSM